MRHAIVDIETTGSHAKGHGITEIAIIISDGARELERWETLIDPGLPIPLHISKLTGITDEMVESAPVFESVADELEEWLSDCVFVAHNVGFDYSFIRGHFETMGRVWKSKKVCTVRLARKLLPGHGSYSLGRICEDLGIDNKARHRAMGDCAATVALFHQMMALERAPEVVSSMLSHGERESWLPQHVPASDFEALPTSPGVYRFLNQKGTPIYIGMSHNIKHRVRSHFNGSMTSARRQAFLRDIYHFEGEATGSVLMARLLEDELIRAHWPIHNRAQKSIPVRTAIVPYMDQRGFTRFHLQRQRHTKHAIRWFRREDDARAWLHRCAIEFDLSPELLGLGSDGRSQPVPDEARYDHNASMQKLMHHAQQQENWAIVDRGREEGEYAVVLMEGDHVKGWAYTQETVERFEQIEALINPKTGSSTSDAIVQHALQERELGTLRFRIVQPESDELNRG